MLAISMIRKHQMYSRLIGMNQNDTDKSATDIARAQIVRPDFVSCVNKTTNRIASIMAKKI